MLDERLKPVWFFARAVREGLQVNRNLAFLRHLSENDADGKVRSAAARQLIDLEVRTMKAGNRG